MLAFTSYPGIIPGSEDEVAWLHFILKELGAHIMPCLWKGAPWPEHFNTVTPTSPLASVLQRPDTCYVRVPVLNSSI